MTMLLLSVLAISAQDGGADDSYWTQVYEGKHSYRRYYREGEEPRDPSTLRVEVDPRDCRRGDLHGRKWVGKHTEPVCFRDVAYMPSTRRVDYYTAYTGSDDRPWTTVYSGKRSERRYYTETAPPTHEAK